MYKCDRVRLQNLGAHDGQCSDQFGSSLGEITTPSVQKLSKHVTSLPFAAILVKMYYLYSFNRSGDFLPEYNYKQEHKT
jgi:hypothetical protein